LPLDIGAGALAVDRSSKTKGKADERMYLAKASGERLRLDIAG
jgi:hypothetical protein